MSYILDALKKLEHEKSRKSRKDGVINISGALFENERPKASGPAGWKIALAVTVAVLLTFGATGLFFRTGKGRGSPPARPATQSLPAPPLIVVTAPVPPVPPVVPVQQTLPAASAAPAPAIPIRPPAQPLKPQNKAVQAAAATEDDDDGPAMRPARARMKERKDQVAVPADQTVAAPADIKLSGIAWQEERRARRAVVNGFLMREGGIVSGARITDIFQNRVRFSLSDKSFEIPLISSTVSNAGK